MQLQNEKANILLPALCTATLLFGGISLASAASDEMQSNEGMNPNSAGETSIDSSRASGREGALDNDSMSPDDAVSDQSGQDALESDHGMAPSEGGSNTSIDSGSVPKGAGETQQESTDGLNPSESSESTGENSNHGMEPDDEGKETSIDSSR